MIWPATPLEAYLCATCGHRARRHLGLWGPCADCWVEIGTICRLFVLRAEDVEEVKALEF